MTYRIVLYCIVLQCNVLLCTQLFISSLKCGQPQFHLLDCVSSIRWAARVWNIDGFQKFYSICVVIEKELDGHVVTVCQQPHLHPIRVARTGYLQGRDDVRHELRHLAEVVLANAPRGVKGKYNVRWTVTASFKNASMLQM